MTIKSLEVYLTAGDMYARTYPPFVLFAKGETVKGHVFVVYRNKGMIYAAVSELDSDKESFEQAEDDSSGDTFVGQVPGEEGNFLCWDYFQFGDYIPGIDETRTKPTIGDILADAINTSVEIEG